MATIREKEKKETGLRLIVRKKEGEEAFLDLVGSITSYEFKMNSADDTTAKDKNIMVELHIKGEYRVEVADQASKFIAEWALEETGAAYKYVELIRFDENKIRKRYVFPKAFVVDYVEKNEGNSDNPTFELFIKENKDDRRAFKMFVDEELPAESGDGE